MTEISLRNETRNRSVYGLFLLVLVYVGRVQELYPVLEKVYLGKLTIAICAVLYLTSPFITRSEELLLLPQVKKLTWLVIIAALSVPFAIWPAESFDDLMSYLKGILFFYLLVKMINDSNDLKILMWGIVASLFILSVSTLMLKNVDRASVTSTYDANDLAFTVVCLLPLVYFFMKELAGLQKYCVFFTLLLMLLTIISTKSRGGFLGLLVVVFATMFREGKGFRQICLTGIGLLFLFKLFAPAEFWERMGTILEPEQDYNMQQSGGRIEVWKRGLKFMATRPLLGVGIGGFETAEGLSHGGKGKWSTTHNSFIQLGAELGVIALFIFVSMIAVSIKTLRNKANEIIAAGSGRSSLWVLHGAEIGIYGYIVCGFFLSQAYSSVLYLLVAISVLVSKPHNRIVCQHE